VVTSRHQYIRIRGNGAEELFDLEHGLAAPRPLPIDSAGNLALLRAMVDAMFPRRVP